MAAPTLAHQALDGDEWSASRHGHLTPVTITQEPGWAPGGGPDGFDQIYISYTPAGNRTQDIPARRRSLPPGNNPIEVNNNSNYYYYYYYYYYYMHGAVSVPIS